MFSTDNCWKETLNRKFFYFNTRIVLPEIQHIKNETEKAVFLVLPQPLWKHTVVYSSFFAVNFLLIGKEKTSMGVECYYFRSYKPYGGKMEELKILVADYYKPCSPGVKSGHVLVFRG